MGEESATLRVWLVDWQIAEDHLLFTVGDTVQWELRPNDAEWNSLLFGDRVSIPWQLDTYDMVSPGYSTITITSQIVSLRSVWCPLEVLPDGGKQPRRNSARMQLARDTTDSWNPVIARSGRDDNDERLFGYVAEFNEVTQSRITALPRA